jgi:hypothetical protein
VSICAEGEPASLISVDLLDVFFAMRSPSDVRRHIAVLVVLIYVS